MRNGKPYFDRCADDCDDQLPLISRIGRGLPGNSYKVQIKSDSDCETYLEGMTYDAASQTWSTDWVSENINGGKMMYQYNLRPYTNPQTFTVTFRVKRPNRPEWVWTTPAIPYLWDADNDGKADVDDIIGVGVGDLFLKKTTESKWNYPTVTVSDYAKGKMTSEKHDKLVYPDDWTRDMLNAPAPGEAYTVNLQYGIGGDIDAPNIDDLAKILGISVENIRNIIKNSPVPADTISDQNLKKYIDRMDDEHQAAAEANAEAHIHTDMGFGSTSKDSQFPSDGGSSSGGKWVHPIVKDKGKEGNTTSTATTVKGYVDEGDKILQARIKNLEGLLDTANTNITNLTTELNKYKQLFADLLKKVYTGDKATYTKDSSGNWTITWPTAGKIPVGELNVFSNANSDPSGDWWADAIRSRDLSDNDIAFR